MIKYPVCLQSKLALPPIALAMGAALFLSILMPESFAGNVSVHSHKYANKLPETTELLHQVFPNITANGIAHKSVQIRDLHEQYEPTELEGQMSVKTYKKPVLVKSGLKPCAVVCMDVDHTDGDNKGAASQWGGETLIALFQLSPSLKLLDVADIRQDRESDLWTAHPVLHATPSDALITYFSHLNAGEEYFGLELIEIAHDKFILSKANLLTTKSFRIAGASVTEVLSLQTDKSVKPPRVFLRLESTCRLYTDDSDDHIKKSESKFSDTELIFRGGHWSSITNKKRMDAIESMEKRYGFTDD